MSTGGKRLRILLKPDAIPSGFRPQVRIYAQKRGLKGFCDYTHDRKMLELVVEGPEPVVREFFEQDVKKLLEGKEAIISVEWGEPTGKYKAFRLDRWEEDRA